MSIDLYFGCHDGGAGVNPPDGLHINECAIRVPMEHRHLFKRFFNLGFLESREIGDAISDMYCLNSMLEVADQRYAAQYHAWLINALTHHATTVCVA